MFKKFALMFCFLLIAGISITCNEDAPINDNFEYCFDNQTNQTVTVELNQSYRMKNYSMSTKEEIENLPVYNSSLNISSKGNTVVYISKASVNFKWKAANRDDNLEVYCKTSGSKAIFMERDIGGYYDYVFINDTTYTITINIMNQPYKTYKNGTESSNALNVNAGSHKMIYVLKNYLDFQWTASNVSNNSKIYSGVNGVNQVVFIER